MNFPTRLKQLRTEKKLTQEQLGEKINVTKVSISGYENGNRKPDMDTLQNLAAFFQVSVDFLLGNSDLRSKAGSGAGSSSEPDIPPNINVAYLDGVKHELTPEVARRLKEDIELFERLKKQFEKEQKDK